MKKLVIDTDAIELADKDYDAIFSVIEGKEVATDSLSAHVKNLIGLCYFYGSNVEKDYKEAIRWYLLAAEEGDAAAERNLGNCYNGFYGLETDYRRAAYWYERAANHGHATAQKLLGEMYFSGKGVEKDKEKGWYWTEKAIATAFETKNHIILNSFGDAYHYGKEKFEKNLGVAELFYRKAAEYGDLLANLNLAYMIWKGEADGTDEEIEELLVSVVKEALPNDLVRKEAVRLLVKFYGERDHLEKLEQLDSIIK